MLRAAVAITRSTLLAITAYLGVLTVAAARAAKSAPMSSPPTPPRHRFVVMIPAHNEERLIGSTLASLAELDYPAGWVQTHVVTDNSTDGTASIVGATAAELHERDDPDHAGKGPALHWLTARLRERGQLADAVVFIDADTIVDSAFLTVVDRHLTSGAGVVQAHYAVRDVDSTPIVAFRAAAMSARTYLRPLGRTAIGGSAGLHGNGMVFRTDVIEGQRWSDHLTEDVELHLDLLLDGTRVAFAPDARIEAEMPDSLEAARTQHERWERGRLELAARYVPRLVRRTITGGPAGRVAYADAAMDQIVPPLSVVAAATAVWGTVATIRTLLPGGRGRRGDVALAGLSSLTLAAHVFVSLRLTNAPASTYRGLLQAPRMVVWKVGLWVRMLFSPKRVSWTRTTRN